MIARALVVAWVAALGCSPAPPIAARPATTTTGSTASATLTSSATAPLATALATAPTSADAPPPTNFPEAWACPPFESPVEVLGELKRATALTANARGLFWTDGTQLLRSPLDGGTATVLSKSPAGTAPIVDLHAFGDEVFLSARRVLGSQCVGGLFAFSLTKSAASTVKNACVLNFSVSERTVAYSVRVVTQSYTHARAEALDRSTKAVVSLYDNLTEDAGVALGGDHLYMSLAAGRFYRRRVDASASLELIAPNATVPPDFSYGDERFMTADATGAYGLATGATTGQRVFHIHATDDRVSQIGADANETPAPERPPLGRFAESEEHLYWAATANGEVRRVDRRGKCGMEIIAKGRPQPRWVSITDRTAYWLEDGAKGQPMLARRKLQ